MAWTNPATPVAGTAITVSFYSTNIRDNLSYLKGQASTSVDIEAHVLLLNNKSFEGKDTGGTERNLAKVGSDNWAYIGDTNLTGVVLQGSPSQDPFYAKGGTPWKRIWHEGNDGAGSGLDADTVDGIEGASILQTSGGTISNITIGSGGNQITKHISVTTAYDPPSLTNNTGDTQNFTVTGASMGDTVVLGFSNSLNGLLLQGYVSATNQVTANIRNTTGSTQDLASGTLRIDVWKH